MGLLGRLNRGNGQSPRPVLLVSLGHAMRHHLKGNFQRD